MKKQWWSASSRFLLGILILVLMAGCSSTPREGEKTLEIEGLTLAYRDKTDGGPEVARMKLQHPLEITERQVGWHLYRLTYENFALLGEAGPVFTRDDQKRLRRLLTKALNKAREQHIIIFEVESKKGRTAGQVFVHKGYLNWRFDQIQGVRYSLTRNRAVRYGTAWRLIPKKGQRYYLTGQLLGNKQWTNWIMARVDDSAPARKAKPKAPATSTATAPAQASAPSQTPAPSAPQVESTPSPSAPPKVNSDLEEKLKFLKHLYENQLIDEREYQKKRKDLLDQYL